MSSPNQPIVKAATQTSPANTPIKPTTLLSCLSQQQDENAHKDGSKEHLDKKPKKNKGAHRSILIRFREDAIKAKLLELRGEPLKPMVQWENYVTDFKKTNHCIGCLAKGWGFYFKTSLLQKMFWLKIIIDCCMKISSDCKKEWSSSCSFIGLIHSSRMWCLLTK